MNDKIKELAQQAAEAVIGIQPKAIMLTETDTTKIEIPDTFITKFAELIVKECIEQIREQYMPVLTDKSMMAEKMWEGYVSCGVDSVLGIKLQFGVEE